VSEIRPKQRDLRLEAKAYQALRAQILRRDGWRCQACGAMTNLEVHHKRFRSQSGEDTEQNLITLCFDCHAHTHHQAST
jgi:5-methylcytosine-specific restriction endonuclease McrA